MLKEIPPSLADVNFFSEPGEGLPTIKVNISCVKRKIKLFEESIFDLLFVKQLARVFCILLVFSFDLYAPNDPI